MFLNKWITRPATEETTPPRGLDDRGDAWVALDRLVQRMQASRRRPHLIRAALEAVRDGVDADVVFLSEEANEGPGEEIVGDRDLSPGRCRALVEDLLNGVDEAEDQWLRVDLDGGPGDPRSAAMVRLSRTRGAWIVALSFDPLHPFDAEDLRFLVLAKRLLVTQSHHAEVYDDLKGTLFDLVQCLSTTIDAKDPYTAGHSERVARIAVRIGQELRLPEARGSDLYLAGLLHDVGKIGIRDDVLRKPGRLTDEEMAHIREHTVIGDRIISSVKKLAYLRPGVRNHHERHDGRGYPDNLAGDSIPLLARILAVADSCDAMMSNRRYRAAMPTGQIDAIMAEGSGSQWDPEVIEAFMACRHEVYPIYRRGLGQSVYRAVERAIDADSEVILDYGPFLGPHPSVRESGVESSVEVNGRAAFETPLHEA